MIEKYWALSVLVAIAVIIGSIGWLVWKVEKLERESLQRYRDMGRHRLDPEDRA